MNVLDAVAQVLKDAQQPLPYREITRRIIEGNLWQAAGKTPEATVNAQLSTEIKRRGAASTFQRTGPGVFALRESGLSGTSPTPTGDTTTTATSAQAQKPTGSLSFTDAAEQVLDRYANKQPMHYREITKKARELGLINTSGLTPEATMYAQILTESKRQKQKGEQPRFATHGKGLVGLTKWLPHGLVLAIQQQNDAVRKQLHQQIQAMPPSEFEELIGKLLRKIGFQTEVTKYSGDGGIDVLGTLIVGGVISTRMAVQVKRWKHNVQAPVVQQMRGSLGAHERGLIITTSDFSPGARQEAQAANKAPIALMNGQELLGLLIEYRIGVRCVPHDLLELGEDDDE